MKIENEAQYLEVEKKATEMMRKGSRLLELDLSKSFDQPMTDEEKKEHALLMSEYSELCAAMREYNTLIMQRVMNSARGSGNT